MDQRFCQHQPRPDLQLDVNACPRVPRCRPKGLHPRVRGSGRNSGGPRLDERRDGGLVDGVSDLVAGGLHRRQDSRPRPDPQLAGKGLGARVELPGCGPVVASSPVDADQQGVVVLVQGAQRSGPYGVAEGVVEVTSGHGRQGGFVQDRLACCSQLALLGQQPGVEGCGSFDGNARQELAAKSGEPDGIGGRAGADDVHIHGGIGCQPEYDWVPVDRPAVAEPSAYLGVPRSSSIATPAPGPARRRTAGLPVRCAPAAVR